MSLTRRLTTGCSGRCGVRDLAVAIKFYEHGLGLPRMESPPKVAFFTLNGTWRLLI